MTDYSAASVKCRRCIIVGAGDFFGLDELPSGEDILIAADAGLENLKAYGIVPDIILGDFDSLKDCAVSSEKKKGPKYFGFRLKKMIPT